MLIILLKFQWRSKGGQVGARARGTGLKGASAHFCTHLKTRFMQKFWPKYD